MKNGENSKPGWHPLCKEGFSREGVSRDSDGDILHARRRPLFLENDKGKLVEIKDGVVRLGTSEETLVVQDVEWVAEVSLSTQGL